MLVWHFATYASSTGRTDVQDTINRYGDYDLERFIAAVRHLSVSPKNQWQEPYCKKLRNEDPLYEIRYKADQNATRALGYFDDANKCFVITLICVHKGRIYKPHDAFKTARSRAGQILNGIAEAVPLQIDGEDFPTDEE